MDCGATRTSTTHPLKMTFVCFASNLVGFRHMDLLIMIAIERHTVVSEYIICDRCGISALSSEAIGWNRGERFKIRPTTFHGVEIPIIHISDYFLDRDLCPYCKAKLKTVFQNDYNLIEKKSRWCND